MNITHSPDPYHYYDFHKCMPTPTPNLNSNLRLILNLTSNTVWTLKHLLSKRALCKRPQKDNCPHSNVFYLNICPHKCSYTNIVNTHTHTPHQLITSASTKRTDICALKRGAHLWRHNSHTHPPTHCAGELWTVLSAVICCMCVCGRLGQWWRERCLKTTQKKLWAKIVRGIRQEGAERKSRVFISW